MLIKGWKLEMTYAENLNLGEAFDDFIAQHSQAFALKQVDYLGINISSGSNSKLIFKIYYNKF